MNKIFIGLVVVGVVIITVISFLPWWVSVLLFLVIALLTYFGGKLYLRRLFTIPFIAKGKALADASVVVHSIESAAPPDTSLEDYDDDVQEGLQEEYQDELEEERDLNWYYVDLTIEPSPQGSVFSFWEPGELMFVDINSKPDDIEDDDEPAGELHDYQIYRDGAFIEDSMDKHEGAQRIKFHVGLPPGMKHCQLRYYFELFGDIQIP